MNFLDKVVSDKQLNNIKAHRSKEFTFDKFEFELREKRESQGWLIDKELKNSVRMKKLKPIDERFEDQVWCLFANMGFSFMNKDRYLKVPYGVAGSSSTKQIDVFAVDDETILFIECKCAQKGSKGDFKTDLEAIAGIRDGLFSSARLQFGARKAKYIFATKNYEVAPTDKLRMKELNIHHFDEYSISYYEELTRHLGECARYQLLGALFDGQKITAMENRIPAIEGKMGGYTYYSFSIEPKTLLKIAYVLHRNEANSDMMPTYQRIIKKNRLKDIRAFIDSSGFFPNSLVISIDTNGRKLNFDQATPQVENSVSRIGILHLPQQYHSAYVIDGQHRLYGYAGSKYEGSNSIPVVAFVNLAKEKQVELFMQINENQKAVSKNLQNTLNADLLWGSDDWNKQRKALRLNIAQRLGEIQSSPLFNRVIIGDGESSPTCCITIDTIDGALKSTNFFSRYGKGNIIVENGTFDRGQNEATRSSLLPFLIKCFDHLREYLPEEWEKGDAELGVLSINVTVHALIRIFNDVVNYLCKAAGLIPQTANPYETFEKAKYYLDPLIPYFLNITDEQRKELRKNYGSGGKAYVWRVLQKAIADNRNGFMPDGLEEWVRDNSKQYNVESFKILHDLEYHMRKSFEQKLKQKFGEKWLTAGLPPKVYKFANNVMGNQNYENSTSGINKVVSLWECVPLRAFKDIATYVSNWSDIFEKAYTRPEDINIAGGKNAKTEWMTRLATIASNNSSNYSVSEEDFLFLQSLHKWLIN